MKEINSYLMFNGQCREAMNFYKQSLGGGDLMMMTYAEAPHPAPEGAKDRIMHARLSKGPAVLMASDCPPNVPANRGNDVWTVLNFSSLDELETAFKALGDGGKVVQPLMDAFWGARFGMLTDKFGVNWMFSFEKDQSKH